MTRTQPSKAEVDNGVKIAGRRSLKYEDLGLPPMGSHRVEHDWIDLAAAASCKSAWNVHGGSGPREIWGRKPRKGKANQQNGEGVSPCCPQRGRNSNWKQCSRSVCAHAQSCLTLCLLVDCSLPGSFVHGIFQARILEWVAISYSRGSSQSREQTCISCIFYIGRWGFVFLLFFCFLPLVPLEKP